MIRQCGVGAVAIHFPDFLAAQVYDVPLPGHHAQNRDGERFGDGLSAARGGEGVEGLDGRGHGRGAVHGERDGSRFSRLQRDRGRIGRGPRQRGALAWIRVHPVAVEAQNHRTAGHGHRGAGAPGGVLGAGGRHRIGARRCWCRVGACNDAPAGGGPGDGLTEGPRARHGGGEGLRSARGKACRNGVDGHAGDSADHHRGVGTLGGILNAGGCDRVGAHRGRCRVSATGSDGPAAGGPRDGRVE